MVFFENLIVLAMLGTICFLPGVLFIVDIVFTIKKKEAALFELIAFIIGCCYIGLGLMLWHLWDSPAKAREPYIASVFLYALWGFLSYYILKFFRKEFPPIVEVFLLAGVYVGIGVSMGWMVRWLGYLSDLGAFEIELDHFAIFYECVVPSMYIFNSICLMTDIVKERAKKQEQMKYENKLLSKFNCFLCRGANLLWMAVVALLPVLGILTMLLVLFGQQPDSIIQAFTKTRNWAISGVVTPPVVEHDAHYLCTVSLRGHKKLVKPTRYGIRRGQKIVVNRQLCVANAFEQLIQERTPRFHRRLRNFYDTYGYPLSKHINSAWSADVVYLLMKPLEWIFVFVLYLFDKRPEDRISSQYLPKVSK